MEARANHPVLRRLAAEQEVLEGTLVALELGEVLTEVLRAADAWPEPGLAAWALAHLPACASHPAFSRFGELPTRWQRAVDAVTARVRGELPDHAWVQSMQGGFSAEQVKALHSGKALRRQAEEVFEALVRVQLARARELGEGAQAVVEKRIAADLDEIRVRLWLERGST